jgi:hypothetical protein
MYVKICRFEDVTAVIMTSSIFWNIMPRSPLSGTLPTAFTLVSCLAYFSTLKMETIYSSKTSFDTQWTTQCYIPEDATLHVKIDYKEIGSRGVTESELTYAKVKWQ